MEGPGVKERGYCQQTGAWFLGLLIQGEPSGECRVGVERSASGQDRSCNAYSKGRGVREGTQGDRFADSSQLRWKHLADNFGNRTASAMHLPEITQSFFQNNIVKYEKHRSH